MTAGDAAPPCGPGVLAVPRTAISIGNFDVTVGRGEAHTVDVMPKLVSIPDAAEFLDLTENDVYRLIGTGDLEVTIELDLVDDPDSSDASVRVEPEGSRAISRMRIASTVLSAFRRTRSGGAV